MIERTTQIVICYFSVIGIYVLETESSDKFVASRNCFKTLRSTDMFLCTKVMDVFNTLRDP